MRDPEGQARARFAWRVHHSLRRRLFRMFSAAIVVSAGLAWGVHALLEPRPAALPLALGVAALVLWMAAGGIAWGVTRPLVELVSVARDLGQGKLDRRMSLGPLGHQGREVALLAEAVNTMAGRIEAQLADQRELLAGVSHELRTPLGHMRVLIDTARDRSGGHQLGGASGEVFVELEREVVELDDLVDQLLVHSRLEFDRVEARSLDPVALAVRALERLGEDASKLEVETEVETIVGDPTLLARALANLLRNARVHGGGVERLRVLDRAALPADARGAGAAAAGGGEPKSGLAFVVEDRGPGFAEDELERVFESFVQGHRPAGGGLGLGLALVARVGLAHGGAAFAGNREGGGARVGLWLGDKLDP